MVDGPIPADLIWTPGSTVRAVGWVEERGAQDTTLWLAEVAQPELQRKIHGADVEIHFQLLHEAPPTSVNARVIGTWDGMRIVDARWDGPGYGPLTLIPAPSNSRSLGSVPEDEHESFDAELGLPSGDAILALGGSRDQTYVQVREVTEAFVEWYATLVERRYPLDVYVSIVPVELESLGCGA